MTEYNAMGEAVGLDETLAQEDASNQAEANAYTESIGGAADFAPRHDFADVPALARALKGTLEAFQQQNADIEAAWVTPEAIYTKTYDDTHKEAVVVVDGVAVDHLNMTDEEDRLRAESLRPLFSMTGRVVKAKDFDPSFWTRENVRLDFNLITREFRVSK